MTTKEKEEPTMVRGVPWALWLSSGLVIALLLFSTVMLMVTMYLGLACSQPTDSASQYQPLIRPRTTTIIDEPTETSTDEEVQQKIKELFNPPSSNSSDIVFPSDPEPVFAYHATSDSKEPCTPEHPICSRKDEYDDQEINKIIADFSHQFAGVFGEDVVIPDGDALVTRFDTSNDIPLCDSVQRLIHPQEGFTKDDKKLTIVNTAEYKQGVRVETCRNLGQPCSLIADMMGNQKTECKQLYHYRTLLAVDLKSGKPYKESFRLPSCCKCMLKPLQLN